MGVNINFIIYYWVFYCLLLLTNHLVKRHHDQKDNCQQNHIIGYRAEAYLVEPSREKIGGRPSRPQEIHHKNTRNHQGSQQNYNKLEGTTSDIQDPDEKRRHQ